MLGYELIGSTEVRWVQVHDQGEGSADVQLPVEGKNLLIESLPSNPTSKSLAWKL